MDTALLPPGPGCSQQRCQTDDRRPRTHHANVWPSEADAPCNGLAHPRGAIGIDVRLPLEPRLEPLSPRRVQRVLAGPCLMRNQSLPVHSRL